jgi:hypothetical protein
MDEEIKNLIPQMNVNVPEIEKEQCLIGDQELLSMYTEIMNNFREDRQEAKSCFGELKEMFLNQGDASTSTKEAMVNVLKIQTEITDKMSKIAELATRIKLKSPDTYKPYLNARQDNKTTINISSTKRQLLKSIAAAAKNTEDKHEG